MTPDQIVDAVATITSVPRHAIHATTQRHAEAHARHLCWYLLNTVQGLTQTEVAKLFGVDRRNVYYGVRRIEDRRDDALFDAFVSWLEAQVR